MLDILQKADGDIDLTASVIRLTDATLQHQRDIVLTQPGSMKHAPMRGVGIEDYMNDESPELLLRRIRQQLTIDGMKVRQIKAKPNGEVEISARYENS